jgi:hypothetical protein
MYNPWAIQYWVVNVLPLSPIGNLGFLLVIDVLPVSPTATLDFFLLLSGG